MTQNDTIAETLLARRGEWVPMTQLGRAAGCWAVHSRIADLRKRGMQIENRKEKRKGKVHSSYRLA